MTIYYVDPDSQLYCNGTGSGASYVYGEENKITDGDLDIWTNATTLTNWTKYTEGASTLNRESTVIYSGAYSAKIILDASASNAFIRTPSMVVETGKIYSLKFWAKATSAFSIRASWNTGVDNNTFILLSAEWTQYEIVFTATNNAYIIIGRKFGEGASQSFYIDRVFLAELSISCAWKNLNQITGLVPGDTVKLKRNGVWRNQYLNLTANGEYLNPITITDYGSGNLPVITNLTNYTGGAWSNSGTPASDIYKITTVINAPLLSPWGVLNGGHPEFNCLANGSFESWGGAPSTPDNWTITKAGASDIADDTASAYIADGGTHTLKLSIDSSSSEVSAKQNVTLLAATNYVFRVVHKETNSAKLAIRIKNTADSTYFNFITAEWDGSESVDTVKLLTTQSAYYDSWIYFFTSSATDYEIKLHNGYGATALIYIDQSVVIEKKQLNNNFMVATSTVAEWAASGFSSLRNRECGVTIASLSAGQWYWEDEVLYYRLRTEEGTISNTHIEIAQGKWNTGSSISYSIKVAANYNIIENLHAAWCPQYLLYLGGTSSYNKIKYILSHNGDMAFQISSSGLNNTLSYCIGAHTFEHAYYDGGSSGSQYVNCISYKTQTDNGFNLYPGTTNCLMANCISSGADVYQFAISVGTGVTAKNNIWLGAADSFWINNEKAFNNIADSDPLFVDPDNYDFRLQSTSPCIGAGVFVSGVHDQPGVTDYDGVPFNSMFPYIGAYDYSPHARPTMIGMDFFILFGN